MIKISNYANQLKAVDLFSGCGGVTLGLKYAGFTVVGAVEINNFISRVYSENHPDVLLLNDDIRLLDPLEMLASLSMRPGELDLLAGCPPCQGFSSIKRRNKFTDMDDAGNDLIFEFLRFAEALRPKSIMLENVGGITKYKGFEKFMARLRILGYSPQSRVMDVADFGVPQRRRRLICLAGLAGCVPFAEPSPKLRLTVRNAIGDLPQPGASGDPLHDLPVKHSDEVMKRIRLIPRNGGGRRALPDDLVLRCHKKARGFNDIYGRMTWDEVAPTITCGCFNPSKGRFLHPEQDRAITLREAALLQGFPPDYKFPMNKRASGTMIGNALPPSFIAAHSMSVRRYLLETGEQA